MYTEHTHTHTQGDVNCLLQVHHLHFLQHTSRVCVHVCASVCVCVCIRLAHLVHTRPLSHNNIAVTQCQRYDKSTCTFFPPSTRASPYTHTRIFTYIIVYILLLLSLSPLVLQVWLERLQRRLVPPSVRTHCKECSHRLSCSGKTHKDQMFIY